MEQRSRDERRDVERWVMSSRIGALQGRHRFSLCRSPMLRSGPSAERYLIPLHRYPALIPHRAMGALRQRAGLLSAVPHSRDWSFVASAARIKSKSISRGFYKPMSLRSGSRSRRRVLRIVSRVWLRNFSLSSTKSAYSRADITNLVRSASADVATAMLLQAKQPAATSKR